MVGATTTVSIRMRILLSSRGAVPGWDELCDRLIDQLGLLPLHPVAALGHHAQGQVGEEVGEHVAPGGGEDGIVLGPEDEGGSVDLGVASETAAHRAKH